VVKGLLELSSQPSVTDASPPNRTAPANPISLGWALRRTALWLLMMSAMVVVGAWLFYASIDPDEATAGPAASTEANPPSR